jgi:hypothetical protein
MVAWSAAIPARDVVEHLKGRGVVFTEVACACVFLQRVGHVIRDYYGGMALAFADVFGGYEHGARPLLEISLSLRLFEPQSCLLTFAASGQTRNDPTHPAHVCVWDTIARLRWILDRVARGRRLWRRTPTSSTTCRNKCVRRVAASGL